MLKTYRPSEKRHLLFRVNPLRTKTFENWLLRLKHWGAHRGQLHACDQVCGSDWVRTYCNQIFNHQQLKNPPLTPQTKCIF